MVGKFVRKQSLVSKLSSWPLDFLLEMNERRELIDWDAYSETIALPVGGVLTLLNFFIRFYQESFGLGVLRRQAQHSKFNYNYDILRDSKYFNKEVNSSWNYFNRFIKVIEVLLILINLFNTVYFLFKKKKYTIFNKVEQISTIGKTSCERKFSKEFNDYYYQLNLWNPSKFSTYLFISFSPLNLVFLYSTSSSFSLFKNLFFLLTSSVLLYLIIVKRFNILINDKQLLYKETFDEYQRKFVNPKLSIAKREAAVDATRGPYTQVAKSVDFYSPGYKEKLFKYHDLKGNDQIETFSDGEFTPIKTRKQSQATDLRKSIYLSPIRNTPIRTRTMTSTLGNPSPLSRKRL